MNKTPLKRQLITFGRIANTGIHNLFRNAWLTTAATAVMVVTLTIILSAVVVNKALNDTIDDIAEEINVSVYLFDDVEQTKQKALRVVLVNNTNVETVDFISKERALEIFKERNKDSPEILAGLSVSENVFPASFEVKLKDLTEIDEVVAVAEQEQFKDVVEETSVNEQRKKTIDRIAGAQDFSRKASIVAGSIFGVISVLIIFNTIRMAVFTRAYEIEIMKLIGATPGYIRGPFLFEAASYGVIAGIISYGISYSAILAVGPKLESHINITDTVELFSEYWYVALIFTTLVGLLIGYLSSALAMAKYLRLKKW